jgi:hypothetical protein
MSERDRGSFFLSVTLTDFVLTLLFLLLLLCLAFLQDRNTGLSRERAHTAELERQIRELEKDAAFVREILDRTGYDRAEAEKLILMALRDAKRIEALEAEKRELEAKASALEETVASQREEIERYANAGGAECPVALASARSALAGCQGQLAGCSRQMESCGLGKPPCWADAAGKVQYLYTVTIHEEGVSAAPAWPSERSSDAQAVAAIPALPGDRLSLAEFARRAQPIRAWSDQHDCRHYVFVRDEAQTKRSFKQNLLRIEDYFYKYLDRSGE